MLMLSFFVFISPISAQENFKSLSDEFDKIYFYQGERSRLLIDKMYEMASSEKESSLLITESLYREALFSYAQGTVDSTLTTRIRSQMTKTDKEKEPFNNALLSYSLGTHLSSVGDYSEAFSVSLDALLQFKELNDSLFIAKTLNVIGTICSHINLFDLSKEYYTDALNYISSDAPEYYRIELNLFRFGLLDRDPRATINSLENYLGVVEKQNDPSLLATANLTLGALYYKIGELDKAYLYWSKVESRIDIIDNPRTISTLYQYMGVYYLLAEKNYKKALNYLNQSKEISERNQNLVHLSAMYQIISEVYEDMHNTDSAFLYMKKHQDLNQRLVPNNKAIEAYQAYVSTFLESSKNKLTIAEQEIELRNKQIIVIFMIMISVVLASLLFLFIVQQQKRKREQENRELAQQLEVEKKIQQIEKEKQEEVLESKTREITSYSLLLSNKNNTFKQIQELSADLIKNPKNAIDTAKKIDHIIESNFHTDDDWNDFKMHFEKVHPSFFDKLKSYCSDLTENNLRICAYFRIGMSTKQIAQMLHISPSSVSIHRHRLKKKLGLLEDDDLDAFIRNI